VPIEEAKAQFEVNVFGLARLIQLVLPHMRAQRSGRIVNISSMGGKIYTPLGGWYHATKFAVEALSDCLRLETARSGIHVIVVEPGSIKTEWGAIAAGKLRAVSGEASTRRRPRRPRTCSAPRTAPGLPPSRR
jgi:short-subunit dehydrogenase